MFRFAFYGTLLMLLPSSGARCPAKGQGIRDATVLSGRGLSDSGIQGADEPRFLALTDLEAAIRTLSLDYRTSPDQRPRKLFD